MFCESTSLVDRLAVENPEALNGMSWQRHLDGCPACRAARAGFARSLAVFRQLEGHILAGFTAESSWSRLSGTLQQSGHRRRRVGAKHIRLAAAFGGMMLAAGVGMWQFLPSSPAIAPESVTSQFPQQPRRTEIVQRQLDDQSRQDSAEVAAEGVARAPFSPELPAVPVIFGAGPVLPVEQTRPPGWEVFVNHPEMFNQRRQGILLSRPVLGEAALFGGSVGQSPGLLRVSVDNSAAPKRGATPLFVGSGR